MHPLLLLLLCGGGLVEDVYMMIKYVIKKWVGLLRNDWMEVNEWFE